MLSRSEMNRNRMLEVVILGSTGSIGKSTLDVIKHLGPEKVRLKAIAAKSNIETLTQQIRDFSPDCVAVFDEDKALELQKRFPKLNVYNGMEGVCSLASMTGNPLVISAMTGTYGLVPTIAAINAGNDVALANKEALVSGGELVTKLVVEKGVKLFPIDSEHSALHQCLGCSPAKAVRRLIITASGGPFFRWSKDQMQDITPAHALKHPNWNMGPKITVDCSTMMNKGLEVIEAHWLFNIPSDQIEVVVHPQSIIHSMVEFSDCSTLAQLSYPDMRLAIQYALTYPERCPSALRPLDFTKVGKLEFFPPNNDNFRCLSLAFDALRTGQSVPCYMNAANEVLVQRFLQGQIPWLSISEGLEDLLNKHAPLPVNGLEDVLAIDALARDQATELYI